MAPGELESFLVGQRKLVLATRGRDGWPHLTALWYVLRASEPWIFTYAKSQKVRNLERDPRASLLLEDGEGYEELRGACLVARAEIHRDFETVAAVGEELFARYARGPGLDDPKRDAVRDRAAKRVAVRFEVVRIATWDHSKLAGAY